MNEYMNNELSLKEIQEKSFEVLLLIKSICEKLGINYYLTYGTLIGAVRHSGFIPWDDDIDIWMIRDDYNLFVKYCLENKNDLFPYMLLHYSNTKFYPYPIARLSDSRYRIEYFNTKDYGLGLFVDIYPLDFIDITDNGFVKKQSKRIRNITRLYDCGKNFKSFLRRIYVFFLLLFSFKFTKKKYIAYVDRCAQKYNGGRTENLAVCCWDAPIIFNKTCDVLGKPCYLLFNGTSFQVPSNYERILTNHYGDYMKLPPESERTGHHLYKAFVKKL